MRKKFLSSILLTGFLFLLSANSASAGWFSWFFSNHSSRTNSTKIQVNASGIQNNAVKIEANTVKIQANSAGVQDNTVGIQANTAEIETNTAKIEANIAEIEANTAEINTIRTAGETNTAQITALADLTNDSSAEIISQIFADGNVIGTTKLNQFKAYTLRLWFNEAFEAVELLKTGHIANFETVYFKSLNCQGEAYYRYNVSSPGFSFRPLKGRIIPKGNILYYYPALFENIYQTTMLSYSTNQQCANILFPNQSMYTKLLPNDPAVTGVYNYPFPTPITVEGLIEFNIIIE